jgi:hypothetical protein
MSGSGVQVGYMNAPHQRIMARARTRDNPAIRFVVWCSQSGQHYVADESEKVRRRCPNHDHGHLPQARTVATWNGWPACPLQSANRPPLM